MSQEEEIKQGRVHHLHVVHIYIYIFIYIRTRSNYAAPGDSNSRSGSNSRRFLTSVPAALGGVQVVVAERVLKVVHLAVAVWVAVGRGRAGRHPTVDRYVWVLAVIPDPLHSAAVRKLFAAL